MITLIKVEAAERINADFVLCPVCGRRLCDKIGGAKVRLTECSNSRKTFEGVLLKCGKCGSRYLLSSES